MIRFVLRFFFLVYLRRGAGAIICMVLDQWPLMLDLWLLGLSGEVRWHGPYGVCLSWGCQRLRKRACVVYDEMTNNNK